MRHHSAAYASHGDTRHVCLYPANPEECFYIRAGQAFDLAERLQTPVLVLSDLDIGMNDWMCPEFKWDESYVPDRGKVLDDEAMAKIEQVLALLRSRWRRHPASHDARRQSKGAYFTRGSGPQPVRRLHRGLARVPGGARPAAQEVADGRAAWCPRR